MVDKEPGGLASDGCGLFGLWSVEVTCLDY